MSQEVKTITINSLGETEKHEFPTNGKVSDIKLHYENIYGYEFYFKLIKGTDILSDDFSIADIDEDITIVKLNIAELLNQPKCSIKDEPILPEDYPSHFIGNYYFLTEDKCKLFVKNMIEIINIDPSPILLKICKILDDSYDVLYFLCSFDETYRDYIEFRKKNNTFIRPIPSLDIPQNCIYKYETLSEPTPYLFEFHLILLEFDEIFN